MEKSDLLYRLPVRGDDLSGALQSPPKPRLTLRIGVIGHRPNRMTGCDPDALQKLIEKTLSEVADGVRDIAADAEVGPFFSEAAPELRLVTGIAHGVDEMAIKAVLALRDKGALSGQRSDALSQSAAWRIELVSPAPLPIAAAQAWGDRSQVTGSLTSQVQSYTERWDRLRASADIIAQLPPVWMKLPRAQSNTIPQEVISALAVDAEQREAIGWGEVNGYALTYAPAGEFLLRNVDLLLAFWDGGPSAGRGGTLDLIEVAHAAGLPVIVSMLDDLTAGPRAVVALERDQSEHEIADSDRPIERVQLAPVSIFTDNLGNILKSLLAPPSVSQAGNPALPSKGENSADHDNHGYGEDQQVSLARFLEERLSPFESSRTYDRFIDLWLGKSVNAFRAMLVGLFRRAVKLPLLVLMAIGKSSRQRIDASYRLNPRRSDARYHWAEREWHQFLGLLPDASIQATRIRESLLPRFIVADELAVDYANRYRSSVILSYLLSTLAVSLAILGLAFAGESKLIKAALLVAEFAIIVWILVMVSASRKDRHHRKLVGYRALAEGLRQMLFLAPLGEHPPVLGKHIGPQNWEAWYSLATARELGLPSGVFDRQRLGAYLGSVVTCEVKTQIAYHERSAKNLSGATHRLHAFGDALFFGTLISVALSLLLIIGYLSLDGSGWNWALKVTGSAAAILPALGAAFTGIRYALDLETKAERHEEMAVFLQQLGARLNYIAQDGWWSETRSAVNDLSDVLMGEVSQFQAAYSKRALTVPA